MKKLFFIFIIIAISGKFLVSPSPSGSCTVEQQQKLTKFIGDVRWELVYLDKIDPYIIDSYIVQGIYIENCFRIYYEGNFDAVNHMQQKLTILSSISKDPWTPELKESDVEMIIQVAAFGDLPRDIFNEIVALNGIRPNFIAAAEYFSNCPACLKIFQQVLIKAGPAAIAASRKFTVDGIVESIVNLISKAPSSKGKLLNQLMTPEKAEILFDKTIAKFVSPQAVEKYVTPSNMAFTGIHLVPAGMATYTVGVEIWKWYHGQSNERTLSNIVVGLTGIGASHYGCAFGFWMLGPVGCLAGGIFANWLASSLAQIFLHGFLSLPKDKALEHAYSFLGVKPSASNSEVRERYRELSLKYHPDKGGNEEDIMKLNMYYELIQSSRANIPIPDRKDCPRANRTNAGLSGITEEQCLKKKYTCWDAKITTAPNCYFETYYQLKKDIDKLAGHLDEALNMQLDCESADDRSTKCQVAIPALKSFINFSIQKIELAINTGKESDPFKFDALAKRIQRVKDMPSDY